MNDLKSGFKIRLPHSISPEGVFNKQLSFIVDSTLGELYVYSSSFIVGSAKLEIDFKNSNSHEFEEIFKGMLKAFLNKQKIEVGIRLELSLKLFSELYRKDDLQCLAVLAIQEILNIRQPLEVLVSWLLHSFEWNNIAKVYSLLFGGSFWFTTKEVCQRLYLPEGINCAVIETTNRIEEKLVEYRKTLIPGFILALEKSKIDQLYIISNDLIQPVPFSNSGRLLFAEPLESKKNKVVLLSLEKIDETVLNTINYKRLLLSGSLVNTGIVKC